MTKFNLGDFLGWTVCDTSDDCLIITDGTSAFVIIVNEADPVEDNY
jgi:hypothetical protein